MRRSRAASVAFTCLLVVLVGGLAPAPVIKPLAAEAENAEPRAEPMQQRIAGWIEQLGASSHIERDRAERALRGAGQLAVEPLKRALREAQEAETIFRLQSLLIELDRDFLTLVASLDDHNRHVRRYAEEALLTRFHDPAQDQESRQRRDPFVNPSRRSTPRLGDIELGQEEGFEGSPYELLQIVRREIPIIMTPCVYERHDLMRGGQQFSSRQVVSAEHALRALAEVLSLEIRTLRFGEQTCLVLMCSNPTSLQVDSHREAVLALMRLVLHDIEAARRDAFTEIGRVFAARPAVMEVLETAIQLEGNPLFASVVRGLVLSGAPARDAFGPVEGGSELAETVTSLLHDEELWPVRQAAAAAVVSWLPERPQPEFEEGDSRPEAGWDEWRAYRAFALALLEAETQAEDPVCRYLAVWMIGALRPLWLAEATVDSDEREDAGEEEADEAPTAGAQQASFLDDQPAPPPRSLHRALVAALDDEPEIARQALLALSHLRLSDPTAIGNALELGMANGEEEALTQAVLDYLGQVGTTTLYRELVERYDPEASAAKRRFLAKLLGEARDEKTLQRILELLEQEQDGEIGSHMLSAFTESFAEESAWPRLEAMLAAEHRSLRRYAREIIVRSGLDQRQRRIREMLEKIDEQLREQGPQLADAQLEQERLRDELRQLDDDDAQEEVEEELEQREATLRDQLREARTTVDELEQARLELSTEQVQLRLVLVRLGDDSQLAHLREAITNDSAQVAREAAIGLGEAGHEDARSIFEQAFNSQRESAQLAALHGIDALARHAAEGGDSMTVRRLFSAIHQLSQPQSAAVQELLNTVRTRFWASDGYNQLARQHAQQQTEQTTQQYPPVPPAPESLLRRSH